MKWWHPAVKQGPLQVQILRKYCLCGAKLETMVHATVAQKVTAKWYETHCGEGHGPTDKPGPDVFQRLEDVARGAK